MDHSQLYVQATEFAPELFPDLPIGERKQRFDSEVRWYSSLGRAHAPVDSV